MIKPTEPNRNNINLLDNLFDGRDSKIKENKLTITNVNITNNTNDVNQKSFKFLKKTNKTEQNPTSSILSVFDSENTNGNNINVNTNGIGNFISNLPKTSNTTNLASNEPAPKKNFAFIKSKEKEKETSTTNSLNNILKLQETESKITKTNTAQSYQASNFDIFDSLPVNINNQGQQNTFNKNIIDSLADSVPVIDMTKSKIIC